jgi:glycosyltransferase involved in cell wall biosynthesis
MKKIVSIVNNSVTRDTRVLKEAYSISKSLKINYTIIGIKDSKDSRDQNSYSELVNIKRLPAISFLSGFVKYNFDHPLMFTIYIVTVASLYILFSFMLDKSSLLIIALSLCLITLIFLRPSAIPKVSFLIRIANFFNDLKETILSSLRYQQYAKHFSSLLIELSPDIVHAHDFPMLVTASEYKKKHPKVKIIYDSHEIFEHMAGKGLIIRFFIKQKLNELSKNVDSFITVNDSFAHYFKMNYPGLPKAKVVKNAVSIEHRVGERKTQKIRELLSTPLDKKILLYQGGYSWARGIQNIIKAASRIDKNRWIIVFMGWGDIEPELKGLAKKLEPNSCQVYFIPPAPLSELTEWTSSADVGIIPYINNCLNHYYCSPNKLWEYPIAGLPIIVPNYPEISRPLREFDIGWSIGSEITPQSIAHTVNTITDDELLLKKKNIDKYIQIENWEKYENALLSAYTNL